MLSAEFCKEHFFLFFPPRLRPSVWFASALGLSNSARRKDLGEEAIKHARTYALLAERKMGEMLRETELSKGGQPYQKRKNKSTPHTVVGV